MTTEAKIYQVHHINWREIPKRDWESVLCAIPIGECVKELPYKADRLSVRILKPKRQPTYSVDLKRVDLEYDTMEFTEIITGKGDFIWERTR